MRYTPCLRVLLSQSNPDSLMSIMGNNASNYVSTGEVLVSPFKIAVLIKPVSYKFTRLTPDDLLCFLFQESRMLSSPVTLSNTTVAMLDRTNLNLLRRANILQTVHRVNGNCLKCLQSICTKFMLRY